MKIDRAILTWIVSLGSLGIVGGAGCGNRGGQIHNTQPPREAADYPDRDNSVKLDPKLVASAKSELAEAWRKSDYAGRAQVIEALALTTGWDSANQIIAGLDDKDREVRFAAALAVGDLKLDAAREKLNQLLEDESLSVRVAVRYALHRLGDTTHSHDLEKFAIQPDPYFRVRANTAMVLGRLGETSATKLLRAMRGDPNPSVRQQASEALYRLGDPVGVKDVVGLTASKFQDDQMLGLQALGSRPDTRMREHARALLTTEWPEVNLLAAKTIGQIGGPPIEDSKGKLSPPGDMGYTIAVVGSKSNDARHRALAAAALGAIGRNDSQRFLERLLKDEQPNVRIAAATAILQLNKANAQ